MRICILSRKDLFRVTRVVRQAKILCESGHDLTVVSLGLPHEELRESAPQVTFLKVNLDSWITRLAKRLRQYENSRLKKQKERKYLAKPKQTGRPIPIASHAKERAHDWLRRLKNGLRHAVLGPSVFLPSAMLLRLPHESIKNKYMELFQATLMTFILAWCNNFRQLAWSQDFALQVDRLLRDQHFDYVQSHDNYALVAARRIAKRDGAKLIYDAVEISEHRLAIQNSRFAGWIERWDRFREKRIIRRSAMVVTIGSGLADWYEKRLKIERPMVLRNCRFFVPYTDNPQIRKDCGMQQGERLVLWFGYCYPEQGIEALVEAAPLLSSSVHVAIVADVLPRWKTFYEEMMAKIESYGLSARFHFLPPKPPNELITYAMGADIGVIPRPNKGLNIYFSLPNKLLEMIMARLPIATARLKDIVELVRQYRIGDVFDETNPSDIAKVISGMLADNTYPHLKQAVMTAAEELSWENEAREYVAFFANETPPDRRSETGVDGASI